MKLNAIVEIPKDSQIKYEYDRATGAISVDRILYGSMSYPTNYGFVPEALDWDGDELDVMIFSDHAINSGIRVPVRIVGAVEMIDGGETDTKLLGVIDCDPRWTWLTSFDQIPQSWLDEIKDFFENYKNLQNKKVLIKGFKDEQWAINEYNECVELMNKYGSMDKKEFVKKMQQEHPEKYPA